MPSRRGSVNLQLSGVSTSAHLRTGEVRSCGCLSANGKSAKKAIAPGQIFGKLSVLREVEPAGYQRRFLCRCECGGETVTRMGNLVSGDTRSCGCLRKENPKGKLGVLG